MEGSEAADCLRRRVLMEVMICRRCRRRRVLMEDSEAENFAEIFFSKKSREIFFTSRLREPLRQPLWHEKVNSLEDKGGC
jgi:hypothetical protein